MLPVIFIKHQYFKSGSHQTMFLPPVASRQWVGENFTKNTFSMCDFSWVISFPSILQTCTGPSSLPDTMYFVSGVNEHSIMDDSLIKLVKLYFSIPSNASNSTIMLSDVAMSSRSPQLLNFMIFISLYLSNFQSLNGPPSHFYELNRQIRA